MIMSLIDQEQLRLIHVFLFGVWYIFTLSYDAKYACVHAKCAYPKYAYMVHTVNAFRFWNDVSKVKHLYSLVGQN